MHPADTRFCRKSSPNRRKSAKFSVYPAKPFGGRMVVSRKLLSIPGGQLMLILVPWKPVVLVFGFFTALILFSYYGSALIEGKNPFAPDGSKVNSVPAG